jgi:hypothetical protein
MFIRAYANKVNILLYIITICLFIILINLTLRGSAKTYIHLGILCLLAGCLYCVFRGNNPIAYYIPKYNKVYTLLFFSILFISEISLLMKPDPISRPIIFFVLISIMYGIIALEILAFGSEKYRWLIITQIFVTSLFIKYSYFINIYQFQDDPGFHLLVADAIAKQGYIPFNEMGLYYGNHPIFHIYCAIIMVISDFGLFNTQYVTSAIQTLSIVCIYLISIKYFKDTQMALFSALIYSIFGLGILYGYLTTTEGFSSILILIIFLSLSSIILNSQTCSLSEGLSSALCKKYTNFYIIIGICSISLIATHLLYFAFGSLWIVLLILSLFVYKIAVGHRINLKHITIFIFIILGILIYLAIYMPSNMYIDLLSIPHQIEEKIWIVLNNLLSSGRLIQSDETMVRGYPAFLLTNLPILIFYSFITAGIFTLIKFRNPYRVLFGIWASLNLIFLFMGTILGEILGISYVIARYHYFMGMILSIMGGYILSDFVNRTDNNSQTPIKNNNYNKMGLVIFILLIGLLSNISERSNNLDPLIYEKETPHIFFHTNAERELLGSIFKYMPETGSLVTDLRTASRNSIPSNWRGSVVTFSSASLAELSLNYDYMLLSWYSLHKGMLFLDNICQGCPYTYGNKIDEYALNVKLDRFNKLFESNLISLYKIK